ncbi:MAG: hypothetical protein KIT11_02410 [Fimbriimonadaceae bacterium]|nr:hypothetical protein [Fimbriimonadaceae bacterium]QYK54779.1 MAG: hypothetical protein KF733_07125 [Fimbriimonadaceae bacterium]
MDPFDDDRSELTGSLISLEFGNGGRVSQLWASDPALPEESEEFQFVLPPLQFGEESSDDYLPGTILIGARTDPDQPWMLSRNQNAQHLVPSDDEEPDQSAVSFEYEFPFIEQIAASGKWFELRTPYPQIVWELEIRNKGWMTIEIGELGFPLAFNNFYDGFGWSDDQLRRLWQSRVYVHKFIGGAASWVFAERMTAETPGLLVFPGPGTGWEFASHVRSSLNTPFQWEGIPVVYAYSKATIEREEWPSWTNEHTSLILEPGDRHVLQMRFVPTESDKQEGVHQTLVACGKPSIRLLPSAVAPRDVGIALEVSGAAPREFHVTKDAQVEVDTDEESAFCFVRPRENGPVRVSFLDNHGALCHAHLMFTEPIAELIHRRAAYIAEHQTVRTPGSTLDGAIVLTNIKRNEPVVDPKEYLESSGLECSLADALFLAEKNSLYPDRAQIDVLNRYVSEFLQDDVQNPGDHSVGSVLDEAGLASHFGRPLSYPHVFNLYHAFYRIAVSYGETALEPREYLRSAYLTALSMFQQGWRLYVRTVGVLGYARIYELLADMEAEGMDEEADRLREHVEFKANELMKLTYPYAGESVMDTGGLEEVFEAAKYLANDEHLERTVRCAFAARSLSPSWWWYGSDKRCWDGADSSPLAAMVDRGETCLAHTTIPNSLVFFGLMDRDYLALPEAYMRMAFGGMMGPWALVRRDGAASMCYCPDLASRHAGYNSMTGGSGLGYFHYLRAVASYVLPNRATGLYTFGCHFEADEEAYTVRPWDGVGRRIVLRQIGAEFRLSFGRCEELKLDVRKRWFEARIWNPSDKDVTAKLTISGLWGRNVAIQGAAVEAPDGVAICPIHLPAGQKVVVKGRVVS